MLVILDFKIILHCESVVGTFTKSQKATIRFILSFRPSVFPHEKTLLPLDWFLWNLVLGYFLEIRWERL